MRDNRPDRTTQARLEEATRRLQEGDLDGAERGFRAALKTSKRDFHANHRLGLVLFHQGRLDEAIAALAAASKLRPGDAAVHCHLGTVLAAMGRLTEALPHFDRAIAASPDHAEAHYNRGKALLDAGRHGEAIRSFDRALALRGDLVEALFNRGNAQLEIGLAARALDSFEKALAAIPGEPLILARQGRALAMLDRLDEALASFDAAIEADSDLAEAYLNRGTALSNLERDADAIASYDRAISLCPDLAEARFNRANSLASLGRSEDALVEFGKALKLQPRHAPSLAGRGALLASLGRLDEALADYDCSLEARPDHPDTLFGRGLALLTLGRLEEGWSGYEHRFAQTKKPVKRMLVAPFPIWSGGPLEGRSIAVYEEQGLGDIIQFSRYLTMLADHGSKVTFLVRRSMHRLLRSLGATVSLQDGPEPGQTFDLQCPLLSLPAAFGTTLATIPAPSHYLAADPCLVQRWHQRIRGSSRIAIGIAWQGNPNGEIDKGRSIPLACFAPLARTGARLISLQKGHGVEQLSVLPADLRIEVLGPDFDAGSDAFADTAAVMANLDLIITSDTSIAHLAGALGRPVWLLLKRVPEWRWLMERADSPWYPSMRIYRQTTVGDWDSVMERVATDVERLTAPPGSEAKSVLSIPGSPGELYDKIAILEIKCERITDPQQVSNVRRELDLLRKIERDLARPGADEEAVFAELKLVNGSLWEIEDAIRDCERRQDFGPEFVALARSVYKTNDHRAALKRRLNLLYRSEIVEEKSYAPQL